MESGSGAPSRVKGSRDRSVGRAGRFLSKILVPCVWIATVGKASLGAQGLLLPLTGPGRRGEDSGSEEDTYPSPGIGAFMGRGCH